MRRVPMWSVLLLGTSLAAGCARSEQPRAESTGASGARDAAYLLTSEPADAKGVTAVREESEDGDEVTLVGRIGGSADPFVKDIAAFQIVDPSLSPCAEDEGCPTPWDYCCTAPDELNAGKATVKIVDNSGKLVVKDSRELLGVKELSTVVVQGRAQRDKEGNLTVLASKVFVKK